MPNLPLRNLGDVGVITDQAPFNLPINAYTRAKNVRFDQGNITRSPAFRDVKDVTTFVPVFISGLYSASGYDSVLIVDDQYNVHTMTNHVITSDYASNATQSSAPVVTATSLANVQYLNREDSSPLYKTPSMNAFAPLVNWPTGFRAKTLRSFGDFLIAMNTQEGVVEFPTRIRFSNIALANNAPDSWDELDTTKSAGFNDLVEMDTPIVDGASLGSNFLIYSSGQVWLMEFVGGTFIFNFRKLFNDVGCINPNCVVEVAGKHYVFDSKDIYTTDGVSRQSIVDGRVKDYIFNGIDSTSTGRCFVQYDPQREEIYFCYKTADDMSEFTNGDGCNRAAVFNYINNTWSFLDLPNVYFGTTANVDTVATYDSVPATATYDTYGGTYASQDSGFTRHVLMVSQQDTADGLTQHRIYGLDGINRDSLLSQPLNTVATKPIFIERTGIDLDESGLPLSGYKNIVKAVPQFSTVSSNKLFDVTFGAADYANETPNYGATSSFNSSTQHKIDSRSAGRYLSYKITTPDLKDFSVSGFDFEVVSTGRL